MRGDQVGGGEWVELSIDRVYGYCTQQRIGLAKAIFRENNVRCQVIPGSSGFQFPEDLFQLTIIHRPRAYWDTSDPVEGTPPVCMSQNSIISHDGKSCAMCPYNDFGSKDGDSNAKACKESVLLFLKLDRMISRALFVKAR